MAEPQFVKRDRELEQSSEAAVEKLADHRWHWTLDESNADRVSVREYAGSVGRGIATIHRMAHGFAAFRTSGTQTRPGAPISLTDFIEQANLGAEKAAATEAVAAATGKAFSNVAAHQRPEVREVLATAQDRAERKGTTVSEELPRVAASREKARQAHASERRSKQESKTFFLVQVEGHLGSAVRQLREALALIRDVDFDPEQVEMLEGTIDSLRTLVKLIDVRVTGETGVDWDSEFASVMEEAKR